MDLFSIEEQNAPKEFEKHILKDGEVWVMKNFMSFDDAKKNFKILNETINWKQENITFYGKTYPVPRKTAWYGYPGFNYTYSGIKCNPDSWTPELMQIKKDIESYIPTEDFNSVLLNLYRDGNDKVSWHADDEKELGTNPIIASLSFGAERTFQLKHNSDKTQKKNIVFPHFISLKQIIKFCSLFSPLFIKRSKIITSHMEVISSIIGFP